MIQIIALKDKILNDMINAEYKTGINYNHAVFDKKIVRLIKLKKAFSEA